ncbi:MAG TPA: class I SAM-dependent rRNA methyltransferase [Pirellulaceae bacterium]|nr:class I SAM-dependent rRNA methyltransferase [Pirellulaceae bacterium]
MSSTVSAESTLPQAILRPRKAAPFFGRHPWVLDSAVERIAGEANDGDVVDLVAENGHWIARGILNRKSRIRVRLYTWNKEEQLDTDFWRRRITAAFQLRREIGYDDPNGAARLVFSESDGLSGLIVDRFAKHYVVQPTSLAIAQRLDLIVPLLVELGQPESIVIRAEPGMEKLEGIEVPSTVAWGAATDELVTIDEHGLRYSVQISQGQKTGFYLDQRENRRVAASYMRDRRVLDVCCYSGGFGLAASKLGGAREVLGIDTSSTAVALAKANAELNGITNANYETGDCFDALKALSERGEKFGAIVLDPPKFARGRRGVDAALRAYHKLNQSAVEILEAGGILVTCSCSGGVMREDFQSMLLGVAMKTRRDIQILEQRGASPDHPVTVTCSENEYLKCFICRVR